MTFDEFVLKIIADVREYSYDEKSYYNKQGVYEVKPADPKKYGWEGDRVVDYAPGIILLKTWETGGVSGGSCWESSNPKPYYNSATEPDWYTLDKILEEFCPSISYLQYKKLAAKEKHKTYTEYEYYGNNTEYEVKYLYLQDIYDVLVEMNILNKL